MKKYYIIMYRKRNGRILLNPMILNEKDIIFDYFNDETINAVEFSSLQEMKDVYDDMKESLKNYNSNVIYWKM